MSVPDSASASPCMEVAPEVGGNTRSPPARRTRAGAHPPWQPQVAHPWMLSQPLPGSLSHLHRSSTQDTTPQTYQILAKHLGQVSDHKSTAGAGCCKQAGKTFQTDPWSQLFLPVTSVFFKLLHTVVALW